MDSTNSTPAAASDQCTLTDEQIKQSYNLGLHIASVFVLLTVSFLGASISIASARVKFLHINPIIINTGKFFGSGVVLATGFIHILPDAMGALTDPCLPDSWNVYGAYAGLFAMIAILGMQLIEFLGHQRYRSMQMKRNHLTAHVDGKQCIQNEKEQPKGEVVVNEDQTKYELDQSTDVVDTHREPTGLKTKKHAHRKGVEFQHTEQHGEQSIGTAEDAKSEKAANVDDAGAVSEEMQQTEKPKTKKSVHKHKHSHKAEHLAETHNHPEQAVDSEHKDCVAVEILHIEPILEPIDFCEESTHYHGAAFQDNGEAHKISTYLLELGIALHSVLIGLTLGTTTDSFVALFIALCFHQFFEAIALGAQIAALKTTSLKSAIYMVIFFSFTTPVGIAIGIGIHAGTYNPKSVTTLLVTGILDSLAAGVLIYVALVNLITAEMGANAHGFYSLKGRLKFLYFTALYLGAAAMAVIGRWA